MTTTHHTQPITARPAHRSKTRRHERAQDAKRHLSAYQAYMVPPAIPVTDGLPTASEPNLTRTLRLLHAMAALERVLYDETGGRYGDPQAIPSTVLRRQAR